MFGIGIASSKIAVCMMIVACLGIAMIHAATPVIGIDLGAEFLKVGMVRTGAPINAVLNEQSKRKTPTVIGFRNGQRLFGESALGLVCCNYCFFISHFCFFYNNVERQIS